MRHRRMNRLRLGGILALAAILVLSAPAVFSGSASEVGRFPNVVLTTHEDKTVRFYDDLVKGRIVLINFMFTNCRRFCPVTTPNLVKVQAALGERVGRDIFLYSITLDPSTDTPEVLKRYAQTVGAGPGWTFLTGEEEAIRKLRRKLGVFNRDPVIDADRTKHSGFVVYGNDVLDRWALISGLNKPEAIVKAVLRVAGPNAG